MKTSKEPETEIQGNRHVKWQKDRKTEQQQIQRRQRCFWQPICIWESCYCLLPIHMVILARTWDQTHCSGREGKDMEVTRVPDEDGIHHVLLTRCVYENHKDTDSLSLWHLLKIHDKLITSCHNIDERDMTVKEKHSQILQYIFINFSKPLNFRDS